MTRKQYIRLPKRLRAFIDAAVLASGSTGNILPFAEVSKLGRAVTVAIGTRGTAQNLDLGVWVKPPRGATSDDVDYLRHVCKLASHGGNVVALDECKLDVPMLIWANGWPVATGANITLAKVAP